MCPNHVPDTRPPQNMGEHTGALNRIIGMNFYIAFNHPTSDDYSNSDLISCVVRGV